MTKPRAIHFYDERRSATHFACGAKKGRGVSYTSVRSVARCSACLAAANGTGQVGEVPVEVALDVFGARVVISGPLKCVARALAALAGRRA